MKWKCKVCDEECIAEFDGLDGAVSPQFCIMDGEEDAQWEVAAND